MATRLNSTTARVASTLDPRLWPNRANKPWSHYVEQATAACTGKGHVSPMFDCSDARLIEAFLQIETRSNRDCYIAKLDAYLDEHGERRWDDQRAIIPPVILTIRQPNDRLVALLTSSAPLSDDDQAYVDTCEREAA